MQIAELIAELQELAEIYGGDIEIQIATQPTYPIASRITKVSEVEGELWIAGRDTGFAPRSAW